MYDELQEDYQQAYNKSCSTWSGTIKQETLELLKGFIHRRHRSFQKPHEP